MGTELNAQSARVGSPPETEASPRGTLIVADRVVTLGYARSEARAVLVRGSRVVWVGDELDAAPAHAARLELTGCTLGPAFVDAHVHLTPTGITLSGMDLTHVRSGAELLDTVRARASLHRERLLWGHGYDDHDFPDRLPTADELADAAPLRTVYLARRDGHSCLVDRHTLQAAPLARADGVERDSEGRPTGVLKREAHHIARRWTIGAMSESALAEARTVATRHAATLGIGSVHEMGGPDIMGEDDFDAWLQGHWPVEVVCYWGAMDLGFVAHRGLRQAGGDLFLDGSLGSHTAALCQPYADEDEVGHLELEDEELVAFFREATLSAIQVGVHAIGDAAIRQAVRCWRTVADGLPDYLQGELRRLRHRVEHLEVVPPDLLDEIAELGLVASVQPAFETLWGGDRGMYETRLGPQRAAWMNPYRALSDRGVSLAFGSDSNVTPMDPWGAVHAAQHRRRTQHGLSRAEAIAAGSAGGRHAARQERYTGTVLAGMRADLAAWEGDPFRAEDPRGSHCVLTIVRGHVSHGEAPLPPWDEEATHARSRALS
ncbi:MAG: amidohydrolase family protein [Actinomycetota bacterium]|nr:amidohydrolase family protein [Actinomycetota bacterium]